MVLKIGSWVRVKGTDEVRRIVEFYPSIVGGVKLDRPVGDFRSWNIDELTPAADPNPNKEQKT